MFHRISGILPLWTQRLDSNDTMGSSQVAGMDARGRDGIDGILMPRRSQAFGSWLGSRQFLAGLILLSMGYEVSHFLSNDTSGLVESDSRLWDSLSLLSQSCELPISRMF